MGDILLSLASLHASTLDILDLHLFSRVLDTVITRLRQAARFVLVVQRGNAL